METGVVCTLDLSCKLLDLCFELVLRSNSVCTTRYCIKQTITSYATHSKQVTFRKVEIIKTKKSYLVGNVFYATLKCVFS